MTREGQKTLMLFTGVAVFLTSVATLTWALYQLWFNVGPFVGDDWLTHTAKRVSATGFGILLIWLSGPRR